MDTKTVLELASGVLKKLSGHEFDLLTISQPTTVDAALSLAKIISKLSPIVGNLIEINIVGFLNREDRFKDYGKWLRQDPGFPDAVFNGIIEPKPGFEIKAWYPLATEITARFKDSQIRFTENNTQVAILAWVPTHLLYGKPHIIDVCIVSGLSVAAARDQHYHNPPDYLVIEPVDTGSRTRNLQQTNTSGYKWQGTTSEFRQAKKIVNEWGSEGTIYKPTREYQEQLRQLISRFPYRLDTNFAKMDRIAHAGIEKFKSSVLGKMLFKMTITEWSRLLHSGDKEKMKCVFAKQLGIKEESAG